MINLAMVSVAMMLLPIVVIFFTLIAFVVYDMIYHGELVLDDVVITIGGIVVVVGLIWLAVATKGETQMIDGTPLPKYGHARNIESSNPSN